jgi:hypothetical protein
VPCFEASNEVPNEECREELPHRKDLLDKTKKVKVSEDVKKFLAYIKTPKKELEGKMSEKLIERGATEIFKFNKDGIRVSFKVIIAKKSKKKDVWFFIDQPGNKKFRIMQCLSYGKSLHVNFREE